MSKAADKIRRALEQAIAYARGEADESTYRTHVPEKAGTASAPEPRAPVELVKDWSRLRQALAELDEEGNPTPEELAELLERKPRRRAAKRERRTVS